MTTEKVSRASVPVALRVPRGSLEEIDERAQRLGMSRTEYMVRSALGTMPEAESARQRRLDELEKRLAHLERFAFDSH